MSGTPLLAEVVFGPAVLVSLGASTVLVVRLERLAFRFDLPEALLGLIVALAADAPEIASAVSAVASGQRNIGTGVILGSNAFNLAALLGLAAIVAGRIDLHRRVILLEGTVAVWLAAVSIALVTGVVGSVLALILAVVVLVPYVVISAVHPASRHRLPLPARWREWLAGAVSEEELELTGALTAEASKPDGQGAPQGFARDAVVAIVALVVVVVASTVMERAAARIGTRYAIPGIVTGALVLAAVTSLPNVVSAVYLAVRGRASATLSSALNSNTLNVLAGLLVPAVILGVPPGSAGATQTAAWYGALTVGVVGLALAGRGLGRAAGAVIVVAYLALVPVLVLG